MLKAAEVNHLTVEGSGTVRFVNWNNYIKHVRPTETKMMRVNEIQNNKKLHHTIMANHSSSDNQLIM